MNINEYPPKEITQLEMSCFGYNDARQEFSFKLTNYYNSENTTFGCKCYAEDNTMIHLNDIPVDNTHMQEIREITAKHDFEKIRQRYLDNNESTPERESVRLDFYREGGEKEHVKLWADQLTDTGLADLLKLFFGIANTLMGNGGKLPLRAEDIVMLSCGGRELPRGGKYELREQDDSKIMFSWPSKGGDSGWDVFTNTVDVDYMHMDTLRGIVEHRGIVAPKTVMLKSLYPDDNYNIFEEDFMPSPLEVHWKAVPLSYDQHTWSRTSWLRLSKPTNGSDDLLDFMRNLAMTYAKEATSTFSHRNGPTR